MLVSVTGKHLSRNISRDVIKDAIADAANWNGRHISVYSSFCFILDYSGGILDTVEFSNETKDFLYFFNIGKRFKPFQFRVGEIYIYTYKLDQFFEAERIMAMARSIGYYEHNFDEEWQGKKNL